MALTPLMVDLTNKNVIIVGGGRVAERRIKSLLESDAVLTVISPKIGDGICALWKNCQIALKQKHVEEQDLKGAFLIIIATNDSDVNNKVRKTAPKNALINEATDAFRGNVQFPSTFNRGKLSISISTNGASPMFSAKVKRDLLRTYDERYGDYIDFLDESRQLVKNSSLAEKEQIFLLKQLLTDHFHDIRIQKEAIDWLEKLIGKSTKSN
ncbi:NAD(P)-binding protein [Virgibacillus siamensis]|uniref:NAD(P)-binding protein n=1 Tax=Virgibacillus siamensis TaxID=480071 RepID=UPI00098698B6|nr:NAD(P)-binding protein [Virgibacillus siamensis]